MGEITAETASVSRETWRALHVSTHQLFEKVWAEMQRLGGLADADETPMPDDWHTLHNLLGLVSVISAITSRCTAAAYAAGRPAAYTGQHGPGCACWHHPLGCACGTCLSCPGQRDS